MPHLVSIVKNRISYEKSGDKELYTVSDVGRLGNATSGVGLLYFWIHTSNNPVLSSQFVLLKSAAMMYTRSESDQGSVCFGSPAGFPCSGFISGTGEGYIIAPAVKLAINLGSDIVLMFLSPVRSVREVSIEKPTLSIVEEEALVTVSAGNGEVRCSGSVSGRFKAARIVLNRNPGLPVYKDGFNETLREIRQPGSISCVWRPVARSFEDQLLVFHPNVASSFGFGASRGWDITPDLRRVLGGPDEDTDFVIGDGDGVDYKIRLVMDRGLGRHASDETKLTLE